MFKCKFLSISPTNKTSYLYLVKKFHKEGTVKNVPHQQHNHILISTKMTEIRMNFSMTPQTLVRKVSPQVKTRRLLTHRATKFLKQYLYRLSEV